MLQNRRTLLQAAVGAGVWSSLPAQTKANPQDSQVLTEAVRRRRIPSSGELVPMVGLGTSRTLDVDPKEKNPALLEVMRQFLAAGGGLIDSSPMYRRSEEVVGVLLAQLRRSDVFYATKVWTDEGKEAGIRQMQSSMEKMKTPRFDLMQVHNLVDWETQLQTLKDWKAAGKVRYIGVTEMRNFDLVEKLMKAYRLDFIQIPYSLQNRQVEERILPVAQDQGVAVLVMRPFERGRLFRQVADQALPSWAAEFDCRSWAQLFLKFVLAHPAVTCPIPATSKPHHLLDNMQAGVGRLPDSDHLKKMIQIL